MKKLLFNTAHPLSESGKPIFIPFGEWNYDGKSRQRLDRAHGEAIANELNARVAKGEPGIPVYQGHPDVPELAAKYPDKGALGWVTKIELANESPDGRAVPGLVLTVEWDRDPGKGFRWFSPYWLANERDGSTYIVGTIASIGLVNNPNIPEFRLTNEEQPTMKIKLNPAIIELAAKYDRLANEANFDESKHPRADDGKFTSGGGGGGSSGNSDGKTQGGEGGSMPKAVNVNHANVFVRSLAGLSSRSEKADKINGILRNERKNMKEVGAGFRSGTFSGAEHKEQRKDLRAVHVAAITSGLTYNPKTHQYE